MYFYNKKCGFTIQIVRILVKRILYDFYQLVQLLDVQGLTLFAYRTGGTWWTGILEYWMKIINLTVCTRFTLLNYRQDRNDQEFEILIAIVNSILYSKLHCSLQNRIKVIGKLKCWLRWLIWYCAKFTLFTTEQD